MLEPDNGSAFRSKAVVAFCNRNRVTLLYSPVRRPSFNGACEVAGRWAKRRAMKVASLRGLPLRLTQQDLDAAVTCVGTLPRADEGLRERYRLALEQQWARGLEERGLVGTAPLEHHVESSLRRVAVRRALELCHMLTIEGRRFRKGFLAGVHDEKAWSPRVISR